MARVISQATFDEVVKENMEEFEMTREEAVEEAKTQFQAQVRKYLEHYNQLVQNFILTNDGSIEPNTCLLCFIIVFVVNNYFGKGVCKF